MGRNDEVKDGRYACPKCKGIWRVCQSDVLDCELEVLELPSGELAVSLAELSEYVDTDRVQFIDSDNGPVVPVDTLRSMQSDIGGRSQFWEFVDT